MYLIIFIDGKLISIVAKAFILAVLVLQQKMAVPPTYVDLGKSARDVFTKGYGECQGREDLSVHKWGWHVCDFTWSSLGDLGWSPLENVSVGKTRSAFHGGCSSLCCVPVGGSLCMAVAFSFSLASVEQFCGCCCSAADPCF